MQNIVATFDDPRAARQAIERLEQAGVARDRIRFDPSGSSEFLDHAGPSQPRPGDPDYQPRGVLESIGGFFANLVESHTDESGIYSEALRRGTSLLLVQAESSDAERLIGILRGCGAIGLEDRVSQWRTQGWQSVSSAQGGAAPSVGIPPSSAGTHAASPTGTAQASPPARAGSRQGAATMRSGPVGTHSLTGGGAAVGMPLRGGTEVGGAGAFPDGADMADTGADPTLPSARRSALPQGAGSRQGTAEALGAADAPDARARERALAADEARKSGDGGRPAAGEAGADTAAGFDRVEPRRDPGGNR
ncbi:hypothetical protein WG922_08380 [Ramlibacter sp. AN1015]|uniref:hypothetical protein n=1 Tax=Ramlibacter sp. AN1015 TaxID=3133428 RepID=UPI0030BA9602